MSAPRTRSPGRLPARRPIAAGVAARADAHRRLLVARRSLITLFAVLNVEDVKVNWIFGSGHAPLIIVIVISVLVGIVLTYFAEGRRQPQDAALSTAPSGHLAPPILGDDPRGRLRAEERASTT